MTDAYGFGSQCELMAGMLSQLPARFAADFGATEPMTKHWAAVDLAANRTLEIANPELNRIQPRDLSRSVRSAIVVDNTDQRSSMLCGFAVRTATRADLRGKRRMPFPSSQPPLVMTFAVLETLRPTRELAHGLVAWHDREQRWIRFDCGSNVFNRDEVIDRQVAFCLAIQHASQGWWRVLLGYGTPARVALCTSPDEARKLFAARDLPPGAARRAALLHWVSEHYRRIDTDSPVPVRSHFRGADTFTWDRLACEIVPSQHDVLRAGQLPQALPVLS